VNAHPRQIRACFEHNIWKTPRRELAVLGAPPVSRKCAVLSLWQEAWLVADEAVDPPFAEILYGGEQASLPIRNIDVSGVRCVQIVTLT
jgi:hypothetical protein